MTGDYTTERGRREMAATATAGDYAWTWDDADLSDAEADHLERLLAARGLRTETDDHGVRIVAR